MKKETKNIKLHLKLKYPISNKIWEKGFKTYKNKIYVATIHNTKENLKP